ncbi:MAG TPA: hypothetical protein DDZ39_07840 [Flavobacteriaceae bacterium]|jgi:hypothetical protein|nr:hypothetical protein [Flavobacteriaceae bacterium]HBS10967.1 hypothetical protein [Flavobacteriaceae bacterium]
MITKLEKQVVKSTELIDKMITTYFIKKLGKKEIKIINSLIDLGKFDFNKKVILFCELVHMSSINSAKFKVYTKINNEVVLNDNLLNPNYLKSLNNYFPFLVNTYLSSEDVLSLQQKLTFAINLLIDDVVKLTKTHTENPEIYYQKKVKNIFSS